MSVYRINVGIAGSRCYRAVEVELWRQIRFKFNPSTTCLRNLLLEYHRVPIRAVFKSSVPRVSFHKFRVILDATALQLNKTSLKFKLDDSLHRGISSVPF